MTTPLPTGDPAMVAPTATTPGPGPRRLARTTAVVGLVVAVTVGGCGVGRAPQDGGATARVDDALEARREVYGTVTWERVDTRLDEMVARRALEGAALVVDQREGDGHVHVAGTLRLDEPLPLAETSTWLSAAVVLTLVDDGTLELDGPIGPRLPWLDGEVAEITVRQLLSHTSGLPGGLDCLEPTPEACDAALGEVSLVAPPGEAFAVTPLDAHLAARVAEAASGRSWAELVGDRLATPIGLTATSFADPTTTGGLVGVDGTTTAEDLGRFLAMVRDGGRAGGEEVLSPASVRAMLLDQTVRLDTHTEPWVAETGVPTYGLGVWRDRLRGADEAAVVSAPNRWGLYPFVDDARGAWGIVVVDDQTAPRAEVVGESAVLSQLSVAMLRRPEG
jgi:CubicO group peptidase (beta-lactamase class C family)